MQSPPTMGGAPSAGADALRCCAVQGRQLFGPATSRAEVLARTSELFRTAVARHRPDVVVFPELWLTGYGLPADVIQDRALPASDPLFGELRELCRAAGVAMAVGYAERVATGAASEAEPAAEAQTSGARTSGGREAGGDAVQDRPFNSAVLIGADGEIALRYRKTHLFGAEHGAFRAADHPSGLVELKGGHRAALMICMDIEYAEVGRCLALRGATVVFCLTAVSRGPCDEVLTRCVVPTRALENHIHVVYANYTGGGFAGSSTIADPAGRVLAACVTWSEGSSAEDASVFATLDRGVYAADVQRNPYLADRRPELYTPVTAAKQQRGVAGQAEGDGSAAAVLIDASGTLHVGDTPTPGIVPAFARLRASGRPFRIVTNTTKESRRSLLTRLHRLGFDVAENELFSSLTATKRFITERRRRCCFFLHPDAEEDFVDCPRDDPDTVVVGLAPDQFDYQHLNEAFHILSTAEDPLILAVHKGRSYKKDGSIDLGPGPFVAALEYATGLQATVVGKPCAAFFQAALEDLGVEPARAVMIGDDVHDDVGGAQALGMRGVLVRTGKFTARALEASGITPSLTCNTAAHALDRLLAQSSGT